ncbi:MAG: peroxide stress protein YaaA [Rubrivivax sp.]|nr:peroxide stress protein YaaA [Rubrivivax sp.]
MLFLLSPAKTLDYETPLPAALQRQASEPVFADRAAELIGVLRRKRPAQVAALMDLSERLAQLNVERYAAWAPVATPANSRPALRAFAGDVYDGLQAATLSAADLKWAQQHLVILSGLYGVLRPLDRLQPYRLEMGTALATPCGKDLYAYWGDTIAGWLNERLADDKNPLIVNLASQEYARAALRPALRARVVDVQFEDWHGDRFKVISFFAKKARGAMARWAVQRRARSVAALHGFDTDGYALDRSASEGDRLVFRRRT